MAILLQKFIKLAIKIQQQLTVYPWAASSTKHLKKKLGQFLIQKVTFRDHQLEKGLKDNIYKRGIFRDHRLIRGLGDNFQYKKDFQGPPK